MIEFSQNILSEYGEHELIATGGQKQVYRINHPDFGDTALKIGAIDNIRKKERIRREVEVLQKIKSPYYPIAYHLEFHQEYFLIFEEFIDSMPLTDTISNYSLPKDALQFTIELVTGLQEIWGMNVVHRDIKPDNILILPSGGIKIIDLGIAKLLNSETITDELIGAPRTASYAAPEQIIYRKHQNELRTDQFAIGIILVQMIYQGKHPFDPNLVEGHETIPLNIINNCWLREPLRNSFSCIYQISSRLLGHEPYLRFPNSDALLIELNECLKEVKK